MFSVPLITAQIFTIEITNRVPKTSEEHMHSAFDDNFMDDFSVYIIRTYGFSLQLQHTCSGKEMPMSMENDP